MRPGHFDDAGFSLLEILVALLVLATSYAVLAQTVSSALLQSRSGVGLVQAAELAKRLHAELNAGQHHPLTGKDASSGLEWSIVLRSIDDPELGNPMSASLTTIRIRIPNSLVDVFVVKSVIHVGSNGL